MRSHFDEGGQQAPYGRWAGSGFHHAGLLPDHPSPEYGAGRHSGPKLKAGWDPGGLGRLELADG